MRNRTTLAVIAAAVATAFTVGLSAASTYERAGGAASSPLGAVGVAEAAPARPLVADPPIRTETVYVAINPCRILDTRVSGVPFASGTTRSFFISGNSNSGFAGQGGKDGGCGIPLGATAISASIGSANSARSGFLVAWPRNVAKPATSNLNYTKGQDIASGGNIGLDSSTDASLQIFNSGGPTDVFLDVTGYYAPQIAGFVKSDGTVGSATSRVLSAQRTAPGSYQITVSSSVAGCSAMVGASDGNGSYARVSIVSNVLFVDTWVNDPTSHNPVATDRAFYFSATC